MVGRGTPGPGDMLTRTGGASTRRRGPRWCLQFVRFGAGGRSSLGHVYSWVLLLHGRRRGRSRSRFGGPAGRHWSLRPYRGAERENPISSCFIVTLRDVIWTETLYPSGSI